MSFLMLVVTIVAQAAAAASPPPDACPSACTTRAAARSPTSRAWWPIWLAPTSCSSASSTTMDDASARRGAARWTASPEGRSDGFARDVRAGRAGCRRTRYLAGSIAESQFLQESRPWPRYATDYRPLVEMAKSEGWTVVAANLPRRVASAVAKSGSRRSNSCRRRSRARGGQARMPHDAYFARFTEAMTDHSPPENKASKPASAVDHRAARHRRRYWSQCAKDETMAESVARAVTDRAGKPGPVVHFTARSIPISAPAPPNGPAGASRAAGSPSFRYCRSRISTSSLRAETI